MNFKKLILLVLCLTLMACTQTSKTNSQKETLPVFKNKAHALVYKTVQKVGNYSSLLSK